MIIRALSYVLVSLIILFPASEAADAIPTTFYGYGDGYAGQKTASGTICCGWNAASNIYPLGTELTVCYDSYTHGYSCTQVTVDDRCGACTLDLGYPAAAEIGMLECGLCDVDVY